KSGLTDVFVAKLNASGSALLYSTYLGGRGSDEGRGIAIDGAGNAYITGDTFSVDFPTVNPLKVAYGGGYSDAFVSKLNSLGSGLLYSTYLGGRDSDYGSAIAVDGEGNAYVTGSTYSLNFPTANAFQPARGYGPAFSSDAFVTKFNAAGSAFVYSTYLGGPCI